MFNHQLFLAYPISSPFIDHLAKVNTTTIFINGDDLYLKEIVFQESRYLGKKLSDLVDEGSIEGFESNLLSLLKKLVPDYSYDPSSFVLLALPHE